MNKLQLIVILMFSVISCNQDQNKKIFLFPENYQGVAMVVFDQADGENTKRENGVEIYDMGLDGIIKVKQIAISGLANETYCHVQSDGSRKEIPYYTAMDISNRAVNKSTIKQRVAKQLKKDYP